MPASVPAGGISSRPVTPRSAIVSMHRSQRTGRAIWPTIRRQHLAAVVDDLAVAVGDQAACAGRGSTTERASVADVADGRGHVLGVERAGDAERDQPRLGRRVVGEGLRAARGCRRRRSGRRRCRWRRQPVLLERGQHLVAVAAEDGGHAGRGGRGGVGHRLAALADEHHRLLGGDRPGARGGGDLADAVAGDGADLAERVGRVREQLERGDQAGGDQQRLGDLRCRGWSRRRPRCRSGPGRGRRRSRASSKREANVGSSSQGVRKPGVWAPWPGATMTSTAPALPVATRRSPVRRARNLPRDLCRFPTTSQALELGLGRQARPEPPEHERELQGERLPGVGGGRARSRRRPGAAGSGPCWGGRTARGRSPRATGRCWKYAVSVSMQRAARPSWPGAAARRPPRPAAGGRGRRRRAPARAAGRRWPPGAARRASRRPPGARTGRLAAETWAEARSSAAGPDHDRAVAEVAHDRVARPCRGRPPPPRIDHQPVALRGAQRVHARRRGPRGVPGRRGPRCAAAGALPEDDAHAAAVGPAERAGPRGDGLVGLGAQHGVDDQRLEPGVPGAARLGGPGVDLGGGEGDLAGVAQDGGVHGGRVDRVDDLVDVRLDDLDRPAGPGRRSGRA